MQKFTLHDSLTSFRKDWKSELKYFFEKSLELFLQIEEGSYVVITTKK